MYLIDAHTHEPPQTVPLSGDFDEIARMELACEVSLAAMDAVSVDKSILLTRTDWAVFAAERHPTRFASNIRLDPTAADIEEQVAAARELPGVVGLQTYLSWPLTGENIRLLHDGGFERMFAAAETHRVPMTIIISGELREVGPIAEAHPDLVLIVPHLGLKQPPLRQPDNPPWLQLPELLDLSKYPNVYVKASGLPTLSAEPYPFADLWPSLHQVLEAFGTRRVMWASDHTRVKPLVSYEQSVGFIRDTDELSSNEKADLLALTAASVFGLTVPSPTRN